ncbi:MAG TPA: immunoglobulin domain-containing protein [Negativicutes bacterium]|nr:immunoglobulin domain-containing protein [Negativicutes bacterium]
MMIKGFMKKTIQSLLAVFLVFGLIGGMLPGLDFTAAAQAASGNWTDYAGEPVLAGSTYTISSPEELAWVASQVNSGANKFNGKTLDITADINLSAHYWAPAGISQANSFRGTVQGNNHTISGLSIGSSAAPDNTYTYAGLFGYTYGAIINDLDIRGAAIYSSCASSYIGALIGYADYNLTLSGCSVTGYIVYGNESATNWATGGMLGTKNNTGYLVNIVNCWSRSIIYGDYLSRYNGGLIGEIQVGNIKNCFAAGKILGMNSVSGIAYVGGLIGYLNQTSVFNSFSNIAIEIQGGAAYAGGILGQLWYGGTLSNIYSAGTVSVPGSNGGMLAGYVASPMQNSYWNNTATPGTGKAYGYDPTSSGGSPTAMSGASMVADAFMTALNGTADALQTSDSAIKDWLRDPNVNGGFPTLSGVGDFTADLAPAIINTKVSYTPDVDNSLSVSYTFLDENDLDEGDTTFQWYRANSASGTGAAPISGAIGHYYFTTLADAARYLYVVITPKNSAGETGETVSSAIIHVEGEPGFAHGEGTSDEPYWIESPEDFEKIPLAPNAYYLLKDNLTLDSVICADTVSKFTGNFNGGSHTVTLAITGSGQYTGMFGIVGSTGNIHNLNIAGSVTGPRIVGGVAANNQGTISNCTSGAVVTASGSVSMNVWVGGITGENAGTITGCTVTGTIAADNLAGPDTGSVTAGFGGVAGHNYNGTGTITNCHADMGGFAIEAATLRTIYAGGIAGVNDSNTRIDNSYTENDLSAILDFDQTNSAVVIGGIAGKNYWARIAGCFATGDVSGSGGDHVYAGGLVGQCIGDYSDDPYATLLFDSYYWGAVSGSYDAGGLVGYLDSATVSYCYSAGSVIVPDDAYAGGLAGYNGGTLEYCYSNVSGGTAVGGLYGDHDDWYATETGSYWNDDNIAATYPAEASLSAVQMTDTNASANMPELFSAPPHFVTKASAVTERYFPQLVNFAISSDDAVREISLQSVTMAYYVAPSITNQPSNQTVTIGGTAQFMVTATAGSGSLSYQWKRNGSNLTNGLATSGATISGATTAALTITNAQPADAGSYTCSISDGVTPLESNTATLTVNRIAPSITTQPSSRTVTEGGTVSFTVAATGTAPLSYQWKKGTDTLTNGDRISGATSAALAITNVQMSDAGSYTCYISNSAGNVTTTPATLTVNLPAVMPVITWQPEDRTASAGGIIEFWLVARGTAPLSYQWQKDGHNLADGGKISGTTADSLIIGNVQEAEEGVYTCIVSNAAGITASNAVTLTVNPIAPSIMIQPLNETRTAGDNVSFTVLAAGSEALSYQWRKGGADLTGGGRISGTTADTLTISGIQSDDAGDYSCLISNDEGNVTSSSGTLTVNTEHAPAVIILQPEDRTEPAGGVAVFTVAASGNTPITYRWRKDGVNLDNTGCITGVNTTALRVANLIEEYEGIYTCLVTNIYNTAPIETTGATLTVGAASSILPSIITTSLQDGAVGAQYAQTLAATGTTPISWYSTGALPPGLTLSLSAGTISGTPTQAGRFNFTVRAENTRGTQEKGLSITIMNAAAAPAITGPTALTLPADYSATSTGEYTITGTNPVTVTKTSGNAGITWNDITKKLDIAAGLGAGSYPVTLNAGNGILPNAVLTFTLTVSATPVAPAITGPTTLILPVGYSATSTGEYIITGTDPVTVTKTSGNEKITWNDITRKLDIAAGLTAGSYRVVLNAGNGISPDAALIFILTVNVAPGNTTVTGVTVAPSAVSVQKGNTQSFSASVSGTNSPAQTVTWSVSGNSSNSTAIDASGFLTVAADETATTLTVTATSAADNTKSGTAIVTVTAEPPVRRGGGGSQPATSAYDAVVKAGNGTETNLSVTVDADTGTASIDTGLQQLISGGTVVTVPSIPDVDTYSVGIPVPDLSTNFVRGTLTVNTDIGSVTVPSNMLSGVAGISGSKADISISQGDKSNLPEDIKSAIGDKPLIQLSLSIDGRRTGWSNPEAAVTVSIPYTPTAEEMANPESIVVWYIDGSGNVVTIPNGHYDPDTGMVTAGVTHFSDYAVVYNPVRFRDVAASAWYNQAVSFIAAREITGGTGNGNYSPEARLSRGDFLVMLMKSYGMAVDTNPADNFADAGDTYYTGYLAAAKRLGISAGVDNNLYAPGQEITRQEMFTLLYNGLQVIGQLPEPVVGAAIGRPLAEFSDSAEIAPWAQEAMDLLVKTGTVGGSGGRLIPLSTTTRAEMAQVLYNLLGK